MGCGASAAAPAGASDGAALATPSNAEAGLAAGTKGMPAKYRPDNALERGVAQIDALEEAATEHHEGHVER
eukprot:2378239-Prymnesium_polylepis.1